MGPPQDPNWCAARLDGNEHGSKYQEAQGSGRTRMPGVRLLEPVNLWEAWPHEAHDFTPWLAEHIDRLGGKLNLKLERVQTEVTLGEAGRVDICARQAESGAIVVIENQFGESDDSHCLRLLGYAANAEANILVWVASGFTSYHRSILEWLNEADTIDVYAVMVRAYRVGEVLAADFQTVVEPPQSRPAASRPARKTNSTLYAEFYRPLVARLAQRGVQPVGMGGWRGRWRSFQTGHAGAVYGTGFEDGKAEVFLFLSGAELQNWFRALRRRRKEIDEKVEGTVLWQERKTDSFILLKRDEAFSLTAPEEELETTREWMADNLLQLRDVLQPYLDQLIRAEHSLPDEVDNVSNSRDGGSDLCRVEAAGVNVCRAHPLRGSRDGC